MDELNGWDGLVESGQLIEQYYAARGLEVPDKLEAWAWAQTEMAEVGELLLHEIKDWVRNNEAPVWDVDALAEEVGDVLLMLAVLCKLSSAPNPLAALRRKAGEHVRVVRSTWADINARWDPERPNQAAVAHLAYAGLEETVCGMEVVEGVWQTVEGPVTCKRCLRVMGGRWDNGR